MMQPSQTDFGEKDEDTWCSRPLKIDKKFFGIPFSFRWKFGAKLE